MTNSLAFVFPGQGSQRVGMLADIAERFSQIRDTFAEASDALGYDVWDLVQNGQEEDLKLTERTQPVLLTSSVAIWRAWESQGGALPSLLAGHSLGEFSALVCSGVLPFADAVRLVRARGQFMQTAVPVGVGAMAAIIGLDDDKVVEACQSAAAGEVVEAVNFNSPGQVVIAGHAAAVDRAISACKAAGAKRGLPLPVSAPFHTSLMKPAGEKLAEVMAGIAFSAPRIPVVHNVHAKTEADPLRIRALLEEQIYSPVLWTNCVETLVASGIETTIECGPGKVLSGLNKRVAKSLNCLACETAAEFDAALEAISK